MKKNKERRCKDCSSASVITPSRLEDIAVELCALCLHSRAQIQTAKEDKLPFPKLLEKIRGETAKRIHSEMMSTYATPLYKITMGYYKGPTVYETLSEYWINQLSKG